jgi:lambda repressor-like predicted transcriptional regulator
MSNPSSAAAGLQSQWHTLHDLDRARAVNAIHQAGTSLRELAKTLNWITYDIFRTFDLNLG